MTEQQPDYTDYLASFRADIARCVDEGSDELRTAVGMILGGASSCWSNLAGAGEFESQRASALVDLLLEYVEPRPATCACNTTEQRTHTRGDQAFCVAS